eukprot:gene16790-18485_t
MDMNITASSKPVFIFRSECYYFNETYFFSEAVKWNFIAIGLANVFLALLTAGLNTLTLLVIYKSRELHTPSNFFIAGLATSDLFTGALTFPMHAIVNFLYSQATSSCWLRLLLTFIGYFFGTCGLLTLLIVATDRYIAVFHPYRYSILTLSTRNLIKPLAFVWLISLVFVSLSFLTPNFLLYSVFVFVTLLVLCVWSVYSQGKILKITRRIIREIRPSSNGFRDSSPVVVRYNCPTGRVFSIPTAESIREELREMKQRARDHLNATKVTVSIIAAQYLCYIPHGIIVNLYLLMAPTTHLHMAHGWTGTLALMNSTLNPIIYCWQLKGFKRAAKHLLLRNDPFANRR